MPTGIPEGTTEVRIRIGGPAGFGIKAAGQSLARVFMRAGYETFDLTEYPSLIKGGHNTYHLRVSDRPIHSHVLSTDILVALDDDTVPLHIDELTEGAAIIYDPTDFDIADVEGVPDGLCIIPVPLTDIIYEVGGQKIMRNIVALGAVLGHMGFPLSFLDASDRRAVLPQGARDRRGQQGVRQGRLRSRRSDTAAPSPTTCNRSKDASRRHPHRRQRGAQPGRAGRWYRLLRRLPDDAGLEHPALHGALRRGPRRGRQAHRRRARGHEHGRRRGLRRRARHVRRRPAAASR